LSSLVYGSGAGLAVSGDVQREGLEELEIESETLAKAARHSLHLLEERKTLVLDGLSKGELVIDGLPIIGIPEVLGTSMRSA
jgi:hypothetical protein